MMWEQTHVLTSWLVWLRAIVSVLKQSRIHAVVYNLIVDLVGVDPSWDFALQDGLKNNKKRGGNAAGNIDFIWY